MRLDLSALYLTLLPNEPLSIAGGVGTEIRVLEGRVWLTEENVPDDVFLHPGVSYVLRSSGRAVLDADAPARLVVEAPVSVRSPSWTAGLSRAVRRFLLDMRPVDSAPASSAP